MARRRKQPEWAEEWVHWADTWRIAMRLDGARWFVENVGLSPDLLLGSERDKTVEFAVRELEKNIEFVGMILTYRAMDRGESPEALAELREFARRFLGLQVYGARPFELGGRLLVRLLGWANVELHVDALTDIDLEDLFNHFGFEWIAVRGKRPFTDAQVDAVAKRVREDLTWDGQRFRLDVKKYRGAVNIRVRELDDDDRHRKTSARKRSRAE